METGSRAALQLPVYEYQYQPNHTNTAAHPNASKTCLVAADTHAASIMAARKIEGANAQRPQRFTPEKFLKWVAGLVGQGYRVICCYEAGPTGFWLHRALEQMGVTNYVVCPTRLDSRGKGVNTDATDALELLCRLDRYVAGNRRSFSVVRAPAVEQEQKRARGRQRDQLRDKRQSLAAQGRMFLLAHGYRETNQWWKPVRWRRLQERLPEWMIAQLEVFGRIIEAIERELVELTRQVCRQAPASLPAGLGRLTHQIIQNEVKDFHHFANRRQIGSYAGLTGGVAASGEQRADLSLTQAGNRRLSTRLVECAWRMLRYQPDYWLVRKWAPVLLHPESHARARKRAIVAFARQLLIDLWKWKTGRATAQSLGWRMIPFAPPMNP